MRKHNKRILALSMTALLTLGSLWGCSASDTLTPTGSTAPSIGSETTPSGKEDPMLQVTNPLDANTDQVTQLRLHNMRGNWMYAFSGENGMFFVADSIPSLLEGLSDRGLDSQKLDLSGFDDAFFAENRLVVIPRRTSSGSVRFSARVEKVDGLIRIATVGKMPEVGTADMADWLVLVPLSNAEYSGSVAVETPKNVVSNTQRYTVHRF